MELPGMVGKELWFEKVDMHNDGIQSLTYDAEKSNDLSL